MEKTALFPIGTVSEQTNVNTVTLRAWERRYGLLKPHRTPKGHRLYSPQDVERVRQVLVLMEQGVPVGQVRQILDKQKTPAPLPEEDQKASPPADNPWQHYYVLFQRGIRKLDTRVLDQTFNEAAALYPLELVAKHLLLPLYQHLDNQRLALPCMTADYAFLHAFCVAKLSARYLHHSNRASGKRILLLNRQFSHLHLETLLLGNILSAQGYQTSLLSTDAQLDHLPLVLERNPFDALLVINTECQADEPVQVLARISHLPIFLSGQATEDMPPLQPPLYYLPSELAEVPRSLQRVLQN